MSASNRNFSPYFQEDDPRSLGLSNMFDMPQTQVSEVSMQTDKTPREALFAAAALISGMTDADIDSAKDENGLLTTENVTKRDIT